MRLQPLGIWLALLALGCGPIAVGEGAPSGEDRGDGGAAADPGAARVTLAFQRDDERHDDARAADIDVVSALVFIGRSPGDPQAGAACNAQGGIRLPLPAPLEIDLTSRGRTPIGTIRIAAADVGDLHEMRLLVRSAARADAGGRRQAHGRMTCLDGDVRLIVLRLEPEPAIALEHDHDHDLVAHFHTRGDVQEEACEDHGDDHGGDDDGVDACHGEGRGDRRGSRVLLGQHYQLTRDG